MSNFANVFLFWSWLFASVCFICYMSCLPDPPKVKLRHPFYGLLFLVCSLAIVIFIAKLAYDMQIEPLKETWYTSWGRFPVEPTREEKNAWLFWTFFKYSIIAITTFLTTPIFIASFFIIFEDR